MTRPARAEAQPGAARCQPRDAPSDKKIAHAEVQAQTKTRAGLRAQKQPGPENYNPFGRSRPREEQPQAYTSNFATDSVTVLNGNLWIPIPYLDGLHTAYEACGKMLESMINSTTPPISSTVMSELTGLSAIVKEKQKLLAEHKDNLSKVRWVYDSKHSTSTQRATPHGHADAAKAQVVDADTAKFVRKQDDRIRTLCTDVLEKLVPTSLIAEDECDAGVSHITHVRNVLEDAYEKCQPVLLEQIREYEQAIAEEKVSSVGGRRDKLKAFFVNITSKGVSQPVSDTAKVHSEWWYY